MQRCACTEDDQTVGFDPAPIREILAGHVADKSALVSVLQATQRAYGFLPREALRDVAKALRMPFADVYGVATFYSQFHLEPRGEHVVRICHGTACHVKGAREVTRALVDALGVGVGQTADDLSFTVESVSCVGCCGLAPVALVDDDTYGRLTAKTARAMVSRVRREHKR
jgi:NADH-quinone oxidoreductase subunit E/NADP-reducing hydrogenase subunit HndA